MADKADHTIYLITGANRGIGLGLTKLLLQQPSSLVIATVRNPSKSASTLKELPRGKDTDLYVVSLEASDPTGPSKLVEELKLQHHIARIDVVIANAGIIEEGIYSSAADVDIPVLRHHIEINGIVLTLPQAPIILFQAIRPLLLSPSRSASAPAPKFVVTGSMVGSTAGMQNYPWPMFAYGASKVIVHHFVRKLHFETEEQRLVAWVVDPGFVNTEAGNLGANKLGMDEAPVKVEDSALWFLEQILNATRKTIGGKFPSFSGAEIDW